MFNSKHLIQILHIVQTSGRAISHVLINSETVNKVNNLTEEDNRCTSRESLFNFHKVLTADGVSVFFDTTIENISENK